MRIAVVGCCHGQLNRVYEAIRRAGGPPPDLVIMCGDFQAARDARDLDSMSVPAKYRAMGDFHEYHSGARQAPYLTLVVGGNHEASAHMALHAHGGWLAPRIWYLGDAGVVRVGGVRIGGLSGIWYEPDYLRPHFEHRLFRRRWPRLGRRALPPDAIYSAYHVRKRDVDVLRRLAPEQLDVFVSHDWPQGVAQHGDVDRLLALKPWLRDDIASGRLGSPPGRELLTVLQPSWWFCAHMHVHYEAQWGRTRFVALDKALDRRTFLRFVDVGAPAAGRCRIEVDAEWKRLVAEAKAAAKAERAAERAAETAAAGVAEPGAATDNRPRATVDDEPKTAADNTA